MKWRGNMNRFLALYTISFIKLIDNRPFILMFKTLTWNLIYKMFDKPHCLKFSFECNVNVCWYFWWIDSFPTLKFLNLHMFYGDGEVVVIFHLCYAIHVNIIVFYFGFTRSKINQECFIILWRHKCPCHFADVVYSAL